MVPGGSVPLGAFSAVPATAPTTAPPATTAPTVAQTYQRLYHGVGPCAAGTPWTGNGMGCSGEATRATTRPLSSRAST